MHLNVSEIFGPTYQGEGRNTGQLASFLRLSGCNLTCSWCDSAYTWDWARFDRAEESHALDVEDVARTLAGLPGRIVVTGGEPLLQSLGLGYLMNHPLLVDRAWDVETNGTRPLGLTAGMWSTITASPKIGPSAGQGAQAHRIDRLVLDMADFKFVVADQPDLDAVDEFVAAHGIPSSRCWLMPEGTDIGVVTSRTPFVGQSAVDRGMNFTTRLHMYSWGNERGH